MKDSDSLFNELKHLQNELKQIDINRNKILEKIHIIENKINIENNTLSTEEKVKLFSSLFRGRTDLFPRRFESKNGKAGYSPVCKNQWKPRICNKPKVKCTDCYSRDFEPLTNEVIVSHLKGHKIGETKEKDFVIGVYPIRSDDTCFFLAIDFDKKNWENDISATIKTCKELNICYALERSRSGNGAHIWIFFKEPIPCELSRKLGSLIITKAMKLYPDLGFDSYDRMFPSQDKLPKGGFGNLIALPLQKRARSNNNSIFIDDNFVAYKDPWNFLESCARYSKSDVENILSNYSTNIIGLPMPVTDENEKTPWEKNFKRNESKKVLEIPENKLEIIFKSQLYISKKGLTAEVQNHLIRLASFQNPEFYKKQAMRRSTWNIPRIISCAENHDDYISIPRGCYDDMVSFFDFNNIEYNINNQLAVHKTVEVDFKGELYPKQQKASKQLLKHDSGILFATTAFGKTVVALYILSKRKQKTLILVHRKQLQDQWEQRINDFLSYDGLVGKIGGGKNNATGNIDIALMQSLYRNGKVNPVIKNYGQLIIDECHHISAPSFEAITKSFTGKFILGLTATLIRKDGQQPIITMNAGSVRFKVDSRTELKLSPYKHFVITRPTNFTLPENLDDKETFNYNTICAELFNDVDRNNLIVNDAIELIGNGSTPIILTERRDHLFLLYSLLEHKIDNVIVLYGGMGKKKLQKAMKLIDDENVNNRIIIATGKYIGEGFDDPRLDTLLLAMPISWKGTLTQYAGRLHRIHHNKKEIKIYDYVDENIQMLSRMFMKRKSGYKAIGYKLKDLNYANELL